MTTNDTLDRNKAIYDEFNLLSKIILRGHYATIEG